VKQPNATRNTKSETGDHFLRISIPQMKNPSSTIVDTMVIASRLPLKKAGIRLKMSNPKTTSTALIYLDFFIIFPFT